MPTVPESLDPITVPQARPSSANVLMAAALMHEQGLFEPKAENKDQTVVQSPNWRVGSAFATLEGKM